MVDNIQPYTQLLVGYVLANETIYLIKKKKNEPIYGMICWFGLPYYVFFFLRRSLLCWTCYYIQF